MAAQRKLIDWRNIRPAPATAALVQVAALFCCATAVAAGLLPDTGQTNCYTNSTTIDCLADGGYPRQDGSATTPLAYTKLDGAGNELDASAGTWSCLRDKSTGLVWEVKTADAGIRDGGHRYTWFEHNPGQNGGDMGVTGDPASCSNSLDGQPCNTLDYLAVVNTLSYCGASDWRLPTQSELLTLVHAGNLKPAIDTAFFPNTASVPYWSSTTYAMTPAHAWGVHFGYGAAHAESKSVPNAVRLVRGTWVR